jgi:hypothetical protein
MDARAITKALGGKWQGRYGLCRCPVHADKTPSLKVRDDPRKDDGVDVICFAGCNWKDIKDNLRRQGLLPQFNGSSSEQRRLLQTPMLRHFATRVSEPDDDTDQRIEHALKIWQASKPLPDTLGWKYFTEHRGLDIGKLGELEHALRYHAGFDAVMALMTTPVGNEPCGIHRTFLTTQGEKRERKMLGRQGVVRLSSDEAVTHGLGIAEGIEDGLAILISGWAPVWAATSAGAIERMPVLSGIEALTIFRDDDPAGTKAADMCAARWHEAGREVRIARLKDMA